MCKVTNAMEKGELTLGLLIGWEEKRAKEWEVDNGIGRVQKRM